VKIAYTSLVHFSSNISLFTLLQQYKNLCLKLPCFGVNFMFVLSFKKMLHLQDMKNFVQQVPIKF